MYSLPVLSCPRFIAILAQGILDRISHLPHLIRDTADLIKKLNRTRTSSNCWLVKYDIKDYFMSGEHSSLIEACCDEVGHQVVE